MFFPLLIIRALIAHPGWSLKGELLPLVLSTSAARDRAALERCWVGGRQRAVHSNEWAWEPFLLLQEKPHPKASRNSINWGTLQCSTDSLLLLGLHCCSAQDTAEQPGRDSELILAQYRSCVGSPPSPGTIYVMGTQDLTPAEPEHPSQSRTEGLQL